MLKRCLAKLFSFIVVKKIESTYNKAPEIQAKTLKQLIKKAKITEFGRDHNFSKIFSHKEFCNNVPVRNYEELNSYIEKVKKEVKMSYGQENQSILPKLLAQLVGQNSYPLQKTQCPTTLNPLETRYCFI